MATVKRWRHRFLIALYVLAPMVLVAAMLIGWMMAIENATVVLQSAVSPDGRYLAEVVRADPGVSSGYEYMVRLMPAGLTTFAKSMRFLPLGQVYVAFDAHREPDKLSVRWTGSQQATIFCAGCRETPAGNPRWRDLSLKYELK